LRGVKRWSEQGAHILVLQSGTVRISKSGRNGEKTLAILGPGEFFGEMSILNAKPRNATAVVETRAKVLVIDARTFEQMVIGNAEIAVRLIKKLARRLDTANELIDVLMHRDPKARVILGLSRQADMIGRPREDGAVVVPISKDDLAEEVGLDVSEVDEVIARLVRLGIVQEDRSGIVVSEMTRLDEFLEFLEMREKFEDG